MTIDEARKQAEVERRILREMKELPDNPQNWLRVSFQLARIAELQTFIISKTLQESSPTSEAEEAPVPEPALVLEPEPTALMGHGSRSAPGT